MMLPMRISVSVTAAAAAGGKGDARTMATTRADVSLVFLMICINMASNAKLAEAYDA
jgi:hypothetical protein